MHVLYVKAVVPDNRSNLLTLENYSQPTGFIALEEIMYAR